MDLNTADTNLTPGASVQLGIGIGGRNSTSNFTFTHDGGLEVTMRATATNVFGIGIPTPITVETTNPLSGQRESATIDQNYSAK